MSFLYPFLQLFQAGVLFPALDAFKPAILTALVALLFGLKARKEWTAATYRHPAFIFLVAFCIVQVLSVYYSGLRSILDELGLWYAYIAFIAISVLIVNSEEKLVRYSWGVIFGGGFLVLYGIYASLAGWQAAVGGRAGAYGMYENHNDYTYVVCLIVPYLWIMRKCTASYLKKLFLIALGGACVVGVLLSLSRGGAIALVFELFLLLWIGTKGPSRTAGFVLLFLLSFAFVGYQLQERANLDGDNYTLEDSSGSRFELWKAGQNMFFSNPLLGAGSRRFGEYSRDYGEISYDNRGKNAHNTFVEIIATSGLLGLSTFLAFIFTLVKGLREAGRTPLSAPLECLRQATLIAFVGELFRGMFNAKPWEWSFYILCVMGVATIVLARRYQSANVSAPALSSQLLPEQSLKPAWKAPRRRRYAWPTPTYK